MIDHEKELHDLKLHVARSQLGTALALFIENKDPISVHTLACAGGEVIDNLAKHRKEERFTNHILETYPDLDEGKIRGLRNKYWNAFKHFNDRQGQPREDNQIIQSFTDEVNDHSLFIGWWDYQKLTERLPLAAQAFQCWYYALYEDKVRPDFDLSKVRKVFPAITTMSRVDQKRKLRRTIEKYKSDLKIIRDPCTEMKKLMMDA